MTGFVDCFRLFSSAMIEPENNISVAGEVRASDGDGFVGL